MRRTIASIALLAGLAACAESGPAPTTATVGEGAPPLVQQSFQQQHSPNASAGPATIEGTNGRGRLTIDRSGTAPDAGIGGIGPAPRPAGSRGGDKGS